MNHELPIGLMRETFVTLGIVGGPFMGALLLVGLVMGLFQAATQINDPAVGFLPRLATGIVVSWVVGGWAVQRLAHFFASALERMSQHI
jgi:flagellar biosynthesis protein FliQ